MKTITAVLSMLLLSTQAYGENMKHYIKDGLIKSVSEGTYIISHDVTRELGAEGVICEIYGHRWSEIPSNYSLLPTFPVKQDEIRKCSVCNKTQRLKQPEWIDEEE
jgi:hypothetical protein